MKYVGYCETEGLPIKKGDTVTIRKGVLVKTLGKDPKPAGKTYKIKINHILPGSSDTKHVWDEESKSYKRVLTPLTNPTVGWGGTGGYWTYVDINDVPEANPVETAEAGA